MTDLRSLLRELGSARSPIQRMKLLTRAWKTLRHLSPAERKEIAARLGVKGFEEVLERFGVKKEEIVPEEVLEVLDKVEELEPSEVGRLIDDLRDPGRRRQIVSRGLGAMRDQLLGRRDSAPPGSVESVEQEPGERRSGGKDPAGTLQEPAPMRAPPPAKPVAAAARTRPPAAPVPAFAAATASARAKPEPVTPPAAGTSGVRPRAPVADDLAADLAAAGSLLARFRILRNRLASRGGLGGEPLRDVLAAFPPGWARRRALSALLSAGLPADTGEAIRLVEELETAPSRRWCASVLLHSREMDEAGRQRLRELR